MNIILFALQIYCKSFNLPILFPNLIPNLSLYYPRFGAVGLLRAHLMNFPSDIPTKKKPPPKRVGASPIYIESMPRSCRRVLGLGLRGTVP